MIKKRLVMVICFGMIIMHCEDKTDVANVGNNCGLETTFIKDIDNIDELGNASGSCLLYTSPSPRDRQKSRMPSSA